MRTQAFLRAGLILVLSVSQVSAGDEPLTLEGVKARLSAEIDEAYRACPYSFLSRDVFARYSRDPDARPGPHEIMPASDWRIVLSEEAGELTRTMAAHLTEFLAQRMALDLPLETRPPDRLKRGIDKAILLKDTGGGDPNVHESFTISVEPQHVVIHGRDPAGVRDGVVKLVDLMGIRQAPILELGRQVYTPRLAVRLGVVPWMGTFRELVFMGNNAVLLNTYYEGEESLYAVSLSEAIPELAARRKPEVLQDLIGSATEAKRYRLKVYAQVNTRKKFARDAPVIQAHPEIRGALTWKADGDYVLCTEHPLVQRYLAESVEELFRVAPLDGLMFINGGESFYHCFMRPHGTAKGHTNCERCEPLGAETVVANLSNRLLAAARKVNPDAEIIAWPYSAEHVWSADRYQEGVIARLHPGAGILTEIEKDEVITKPEGVRKHVYDYSIDLIGPGQRALRQIAACTTAGVPIYIKSEPELAFEAPGLPYIPCLDRWADRAEAMASCGATGAWVFPYFRPYHASIAGEVIKSFWWEPIPDKEDILQTLARRIAGEQAGPHLRAAWKHASDAIAWSPEQPAYFRGPYYIGPAHPMCVSPAEALPDVFYGRFLFMGEATDAAGLKMRPIYVTSPTGDVPVFGRFYRRMESCLRKAVEELDSAVPLVTERHRLTFEAASSPIRWFYFTARTQANFYESCMIRDALTSFAAQQERSPEELEAHRKRYERWRSILHDEKANAEAALPWVEKDMRLDVYYRIDHAFAHSADMIRTKLRLLETEIHETLPAIARRCGL